MAFDATFWVAVSFVIFFGALIYLKVPQNINNLLSKMITDIKNEIDESEKLRAESKRLSLEKDIEKEILKAEEEINQLKTTSQEKVTKIAIETSSDLVKQLIGEDINKSSLSAIVEDLSKKEMEKHNGI